MGIFSNIGKSIDFWGGKLGNPIKDYGFSESLQNQPSPSQQSQAQWPQASVLGTSAGPVHGPQQVYGPSAGEGSPISTPPSGNGTPSPNDGGGGGGGGGGDNNYFQDQPQGPSMEEIENAYQGTMGALGGMETQAGTSHETTRSGIELGAKEARMGVESREAAESAKLAEGEQVAQTGAKGAISKARTLYGDLKRSELSRLSALGLRGGSTAEASMELLGRETAGQIGGTRQELTRVLNSIQVEGQRIQKWMTDQMGMLQEKKTQALSEAKDKFDLRVQEIGLMKAQAGQDKAAARMDALESLRQDTMRVDEFNSSMAFQLEQWKFQKEQTLQEAARQAAKVGEADYPEPDPYEGVLTPESSKLDRKTGTWITTMGRPDVKDSDELTDEEKAALGK